MDKVDIGKILQFYSNKKVMVTGHTGFKGSWLTFLLTELGAQVMGYALPPASEPCHFSLLGLDKKINHLQNDIRNKCDLKAAIQSFQPEIIFHLAAQPLVKKSYLDPLYTFDVNVMGATNLLECVRQCRSVRSLIYVTSDKCYENVEWIWGYRENDALGGRDPYSASKAAAEIVFSAYSRSFFVKNPVIGAASVRAGNVIGGGDWADDRIVPDCIRSIQIGEPIKLRNPNATRPWQHVLEPISGYIMLGARLYNEPTKYSGNWNFGPDSREARTVLDVADSIVKSFGKGTIEIVNSTNDEHEANLLQLNCDKANLELDWQPRWCVEKTLSATAEWYRSILNGKNAQDVTRAQIYDYFPEIS